MSPEAAKRLFDAHAACVAIEAFVRTLDFQGFSDSLLIRSAVERQFEIVGESLGRAVHDEPMLGERVPQLPRIVGLRNRLIHGYDSVDDQIIWDIIKTKLPELRKTLADQLREAGYNPEP